jgi:hypothetical protein
MKKFLPLFFVFITAVVSAQSRGGDVVYLKNGSVIKGTIIKNLSDSTVAITTQDGNFFVFNNREVARTLINNAGNSNSSSASTHRNNLWVGFNIEPQYQNIFKSASDAQAILLQYQETRQLPGSAGVQLGFKLNYLPAGLVGFETGLQYHYYVSRDVLSQPYNGVTAYRYTRNELHNLEIPLLINVHSQGKKVRFYSSDGFSAGLTLGANHSISNYASGYTGWDTSFTSHADSTTSLYCTILVSGGVQLSLAPNILFNLTAAFRISTGGILGALNPTYVPNPYPYFPYSVGLNAEILFHTPGGVKKRNGDFWAISETVTPYDEQQKYLDKAKATHQSWNNCVMITSNGDTVRGYVQKSADYRLTGGLFARGKVLFATLDGQEQKIRANQFFELYIPAEDTGYRKYITVTDNADIESRKVYRVVVDGKCQLLSQNIEGSSPPLGVEETGLEKFYFYYNDKLMATNFKAASANNQAFINQCKDFFSDCPDLVQKITTQTIPSGNLTAIVQEFNKCIANRQH